jgi:hypothetical protein
MMLGHWEQLNLDNLALSFGGRWTNTHLTEEDEIRFTTLIINLFQSGSTLDNLNPQEIYGWALGQGWDSKDANFASTTIVAVHRTLVYVREIPA